MDYSGSSSNHSTISNKVYIGWVPTVLGNLSFKLVGHSGYPFDFYSIINEEEKKLTITCLQRRIPHDYAFPVPFVSEKRKLLCHAWLGSKTWFVWLTRLFGFEGNRENIESCFLLICTGYLDGEQHSVQKIEGTVYRVFHEELEEQKNMYELIRRSIIKINENTDDPDNSNCISFLNEEIKRIFCVCCDLTLDRQGICEIKNIRFNENNETMLSTLEKEKEKQLNDLVNQFFYFIKDAFHSHKHHHHTEDTLISAYPIKDENDVFWFDNNTKNIYRNFIRRRNEFTKISLGIFCYIRTFKLISKKWCEVNGYKDSTLLEDRTMNLDELENSIKICINKKEDRQKNIIWDIGFGLAIFAICIRFFEEKIKLIFIGHEEIYAIIFISIFYYVSVFVKNLNPFDPSCVNINFFKTESRSFIQTLNIAIALTKDKNNLLFYIAIIAILIASFGFYFIYGFKINILYFIVSVCLLFTLAKFTHN